MTRFFEHPLSSLDGLDIQATGAAITPQGELRLENGLVLFPNLTLNDLVLEVSVFAEGPCYAGLAFRAADRENYELAYAQPHTSGQWDALQYDPVLRGSNTWQVFHGPAYQGSAQVPTGQWMRLRVEACGERAAISLDEQPPLVVEHLAFEPRPGLFGLWTYLPARFKDLVVRDCPAIQARGMLPSPVPGTPDAWYIEDYGAAPTEPGGVLCLNRYLPAQVGRVRAWRRFTTPAPGMVHFSVGFSDTLLLEVDGEAIYTGENRFHSTQSWNDRGYIAPNFARVEKFLEAGDHLAQVRASVDEPFGWGLVIALEGGQWGNLEPIT
jgi:hypothetical protein